VGGKDLWHLGFLFAKFFYDEVSAKNPDWIADRYSGRVRWTDPEPRRAMEAYAELFLKGYVEKGFMSTSDSQTASMLVWGRAAMLYSGTWMFQQIQEADPSFEIGWFPLPSKDGKINLIGGSTAAGWAISARCAESTEKAKAALDYIRFFFSRDQYLRFVKESNGIPSTREPLRYESIQAMEKALDAFNAAKSKQLMWNSRIGRNELPPSFRNYAYKVSIEWLLGSPIGEGLKKLDEEWDREARDFNPVLRPD
jgi:raffinose/stachyose/melibiose transport system substrate-binding protein